MTMAFVVVKTEPFSGQFRELYSCQFSRRKRSLPKHTWTLQRSIGSKAEYLKEKKKKSTIDTETIDYDTAIVGK